MYFTSPWVVVCNSFITTNSDTARKRGDVRPRLASYKLFFFSLFNSQTKRCRPSHHPHVCMYSDTEHPNWWWLRPLMSQPQEARNAHLASSKGKGRLPASSSTPSCSKGGNSFEPPSFFVLIRSMKQFREERFFFCREEALLDYD